MVVAAGRQVMVCSRVWDTWLHQSSSEQTPVLKLSSGDRNTGMPFPPHNTCLWIYYMVKFQPFGIDEANTTTTIKWSQKHKKVHLILLCNSIGQRKGAQKMESSLVYWGSGGCKHAYECWGKLMPETNYSIKFPNNGMEMTLPQPPLFFQGQNHFSFVQESKISMGWWNRIWKYHHSVCRRMLHQNTFTGHCWAMFNIVSSNVLPWRFPIFAFCLVFAFLETLQ